MNQLTAIAVVTSTAIIAATITFVANQLISRLKDISITVKVYQQPGIAPSDKPREKPPTVHLTDAVIKSRREALKDKQ